MIAFLSSSRRRWGGGLLCLLFALTALLSACSTAQSSAATDHPANAGKTAQIDPATADRVKGSPVITDEVDQSQAPVRDLKVVPRNTKIIYVCVPIEADLDDRYSVRWYHNGKHLTTLDNELVLSDFAINGWASFPVASEAPWATGTYTVEVYFMDMLAGVTTFTIK